MARCLISFGANLGVPATTIGQAAAQIKQLLGQRLISFHLSRLVRTPAVGGPTGQPPFVNAVAALEVHDASAWDLWHVVREVEFALGRVRQERWEARRIDLDVLLFDDQRIWTPQFKLPHPRMVMRRFILEPACDVAADWIEPVSEWTLHQLSEALVTAPASLLIVSANMRRDRPLVDQAARTARCELVTMENNAGETREQPAGRWLALMSIDELLARPNDLRPEPRLVFVLTPPSQATDAAWEDWNRPTARWMGLCPKPSPDNPDQFGPWPLKGPRYLLSTDDPTWAQHEIVAAMDAMDCPVEPMRT